MAKKRVFKTDFGETSHVTDPETLFYDLRGRSSDIKHLWSHQADVLRDYNQSFLQAQDVAIELPTGAGKTLVGLLIAEFRRRRFHERVAYLCPTRQLARQVGAQACKYGIKAHVFVGRQRDYPPGEFSEFQSSNALAITTYSAVFNTNPRICDAQSLILDDAHASENYIASMWSVEIARSDNRELYQCVVTLLRDGLPASFYADIMSSSEPETGRIELVPGRYVRQYSRALRDLLDDRLKDETAAWYAWKIIREHTPACGVFVSWDSILIRPLIPPSFTHAPFTQANQRVYMSATLGAGGELERVTGVKRIQRIRIPPGWDKRGSGRRLFLMPQVAMSDNEALRVVLAAATEFKRTLVLTPSQHEASQFRNHLTGIGLAVLDAGDIEDSIDPFTAREGAALVLSRYDGLDLPDEACRLLIIGGLPCGTNLQERFLWSGIGASSLLRDRVLTRFTQGVGRCTRSDNDYAVVIAWGRPLVEFLLKQDNRRLLHPELQAELAFGIENSRDNTVDFKQLWEAFVEQREEWKHAEQAIVRLRDESSREPDPVSERLRAVVSDEVSYLHSMWNGDYESALECARKVADSLEGDETKGYRGWWYYLAADAAMALHETSHDDNLVGTARDCLKRAGKCCPVISWFARLAEQTRGQAEPLEIDEVTAEAIENMRQKLTEWAIFGSRFEREVGQAINDLQATDHRQFHRGLKVLGEMLGFRAELPGGEGDPDCIWSIGSELHVVYEAKSEHTASDAIGINDVRQAQSHEDWVRKHRSCDSRTRIVPIIVSPRTSVSAKAVAYAKSLCHVLPGQMKTMCEEIAAVLRRVRAIASGLSDEKLLETLRREVVAAKLTPQDVVGSLSAEPVSNMPKKGG